MSKQSNVTNNVVVQIDDEILKQLLEKISDLQSQIKATDFALQTLRKDFYMRHEERNPQ